MSVVIKKNSEIVKELKVLRMQLKENKKKELLIKNQINDFKDLQLSLKFNNVCLSSLDNYEIKINPNKNFNQEILFLKKELTKFINSECNECASIMKSVSEIEFLNTIQLVQILKRLNYKKGLINFNNSEYLKLIQNLTEPYKINFKNKVMIEWKNVWLPYFTRRTNDDVFKIIESYLF